MSSFYPDEDQPIEVLDEQSSLRGLYETLGRLRKINISPPIDLTEASSIMASNDAKAYKMAGETSGVKVHGLEKGKLVAVRRGGGIGNQWHDIHLIKLKNDSRFMTEIPLTDPAVALGWSRNEIVLYPDDDIFRTIRVQQTPAGYKIDFSDEGHDPAYTKDGSEKCIIRGLDDAQFFLLDQSTSNKALRLAEKFKR